jgi:hypothetical protein
MSSLKYILLHLVTNMINRDTVAVSANNRVKLLLKEGVI